MHGANMQMIHTLIGSLAVANGGSIIWQRPKIKYNVLALDMLPSDQKVAHKFQPKDIRALKDLDSMGAAFKLVPERKGIYERSTGRQSGSR